MEKWYDANHFIHIWINEFIINSGILDGIGSDIGMTFYKRESFVLIPQLWMKLFISRIYHTSLFMQIPEWKVKKKKKKKKKKKNLRGHDTFTLSGSARREA
jgi:hypothetical protein